ncbi:MAG: hypothetical protein V4498_05355 [candidate division FCPU426 bacterium]
MNIRSAVFAGFILACFAISPLSSSADSYDSEKPPAIFVDEGACPFECCVYRDWLVTKTTTLFDKPHGKKITGHLKDGMKVRALTGIVYVVPTKMRVVFGRKSDRTESYEVGEIIYLLTNLGEGWHKVWHRGEIISDELDIYEQDENCAIPSEACWARVIEDHRNEEVWWVKIQIKTGEIGWAEVDKNFDNMDACG